MGGVTMVRRERESAARQSRDRIRQRIELRRQGTELLPDKGAHTHMYYRKHSVMHIRDGDFALTASTTETGTGKRPFCLSRDSNTVS
jgi:hypothetical protein